MDTERYQNELMELVVKLANRYTHLESTSIPYEKAEGLMHAVVYTIAHASEDYLQPLNNREPLQLDGCKEKKEFLREIKNSSLEERYLNGKEQILRQCKTLQIKYNAMAHEFKDYGCVALKDTFLKAIPGFFKYYDPEYAPFSSIITMDYQLLYKNYLNLEGGDAIEEYLHEIDMEQRFLSRLKETYVIRLLRTINPEYENSFDNLTEPVLTNLLLRIMLSTSIIKTDEYSISNEQIKHLEELITRQIEKLVIRRYPEEEGMEAYLMDYREDIYIRIKNANENNVLAQLIPKD